MKKAIGLPFVLCLAVLSPLLAKKPNVVIILTDDQDWGDLSVSGNTNLSTPNIDPLGRVGEDADTQPPFSLFKWVITLL